MLRTATHDWRFYAVLAWALLMSPVCIDGVSADEAVYFVSPSGNDAWSGRLADANEARTDGPWKTLAKACATVQAGETCRLRGGTYREVLKPLRDGTSDDPITFEAQPGETVVLSGADPVGDWKSAGDGLFQASLAWDLADENQLFADEAMLTEARWPNMGGSLLSPPRARVASGSPNTIVDPKLPGDDGFWKDAVLWCAGGHRWYCWSSTVTAFDSQTKTLTFDKPQPDKWYTPVQGNEYVLIGTRSALDAEGEWWLDRQTKTLWLKPPGAKDPNTLRIEAKRRIYTMDFSGREHLHIQGIQFRAGGILTDADSQHLLLEKLKGQYIGHSYVNDVSRKGTVLIDGHHIELNGCELAYASGSLIRIAGHDNRLINCFLHDGDYAGKWSGAASFSGRRQLISHNTICDSGRDVCSIHGLMESLIQYNDLSNAGWLTADLGMTYGHNTDFMGTVIRYNWVHDNLAHGHTAGIYFDHCSHNAIVHHNVVWNVPGMPLQVNNPAYFMLCYNNTLWNSGRVSTFDHSHRDDMFGCRFQNNISAAEFKLPPHVVTQPNLIDATPGLIDPSRRNFELSSDSAARRAGVRLAGIAEGTANQPPDMGAYPPQWKAGHDFQNPPLVTWDVPEAAYSNAICNAAFELGTSEFWATSGSGKAQIVAGNGWGNGFGRGQVQNTGTSKFELRLTGPIRLEQAVDNLHPNTQYQLSAWLKATSEGSLVTLGVRGHGGPDVTAPCASKNWERATVDFTTGNDASATTIFVECVSDTDAGFIDNLGLPRNPREGQTD